FTLFQAQQYDELDELANTSLMHDVEPDISQNSFWQVIEYWLGSVERTPEQMKARVDELQLWLNAKPHSRAAQYLVALAVSNYAWAVRGANFAGQTQPEAMKTFADEIRKAEKLIRGADELGVPSAPISALRISLSMAQGESHEQLIKHWQRGIL